MRDSASTEAMCGTSALDSKPGQEPKMWSNSRGFTSAGSPLMSRRRSSSPPVGGAQPDEDWWLMGRLFESGGGERTGRLLHCEEKRDEIGDVLKQARKQKQQAKKSRHGYMLSANERSNE
jgi:hypothetical protein